MIHQIDWQKAVHDPRFWAVRYGKLFPGVTQVACESYVYEFYNLDILEDDPLFGYAGEGDDPRSPTIEAGWRTLFIPFPESYSWQMELTTQDNEAAGINHALFHPSMDPSQILGHVSGQGYTRGTSLAAENESLPGLRWAELKQIENCLTRQNFNGFDVRAIMPLLYPVVWRIAFDELEEVRYKLALAWQELGILNTVQANTWLDETITMYDKGQVFMLDAQREWRPLYPTSRANQQDLWVAMGQEGWKTTNPTSMRYIANDVHQFIPFFSMLEQYA